MIKPAVITHEIKIKSRSLPNNESVTIANDINRPAKNSRGNTARKNLAAASCDRVLKTTGEMTITKNSMKPISAAFNTIR